MLEILPTPRNVVNHDNTVNSNPDERNRFDWSNLGGSGYVWQPDPPERKLC